MDPCDGPRGVAFRACLERAGLCQPIFWLRSSPPAFQCRLCARMQFAVGKGGIRLIKNIPLVVLL